MSSEGRAQTFDETACVMRAGRPAVFPTDTVYGVGVAVEHAATPEVLFDLKRRPHGKPVAWLVASADALDVYGEGVGETARRLAQTFWPGPLTIIVRAGENVPRAFRSQSGTIGLRMPANRTTLRLIEAVGCPIAATSANFAGEAPPYAANDIDPAFAEAVGCTLTDGERKSGIASTVVDCTDGRVRIVREGAVTLEDIGALG